MRSDWLLKLRIAIHFKSTREEFAPENNVIVAKIYNLKSSLCAILPPCFSIYLNNYSPRRYCYERQMRSVLWGFS